MVLLSLFALTACNSTTGDSTKDTNILGLPKKEEKAEAREPEPFNDPRAFCPRAIIRSGTETYRVFENGVKEDDANALASLRLQGTLTQTARECNYTPTNLNMKIGINGRVINGPTAATGTFEMPVRVAVVRGDEALYSQLHRIQVIIPEGGSFASFRFIDDQISLPIPEKKNLIVHVGFDEGPGN